MQKVRQKEITKEVSSKAIDVFKSDWDKYEWIEIDSTIINNAHDLIKKLITAQFFLSYLSYTSLN